MSLLGLSLALAPSSTCVHELLPGTGEGRVTGRSQHPPSKIKGGERLPLADQAKSQARTLLAPPGSHVHLWVQPRSRERWGARILAPEPPHRVKEGHCARKQGLLFPEGWAGRAAGGQPMPGCPTHAHSPLPHHTLCAVKCSFPCLHRLHQKDLFAVPPCLQPPGPAELGLPSVLP